MRLPGVNPCNIRAMHICRGHLGYGTRGVRALSCALLVGAAPFTAKAQADAGSRALAVQLFDEAELLFESGNFAEACPKYGESYRLDPQLGALLHLAECFEKNQQLASAWGSFREAEEMAHRRSDPRADIARDRASALEPKLSYLVVKVPPAAQVPGLTVSRNGTAVPKVLWGSRAAVDAGTYRLEARAPGYEPWRKEIAVGAEVVTEMVVPKLVGAPPSPNPTSASGTDRTSPGHSQRIAVIAVGGLGLVSLGVGGFLGLSAQGSLSDSKGLCNESDYCTPRGDELRQSAKSKALFATVATGVGAAGIATAAVLWFTAPRGSQAERTGSSQRRRWTIVPTNEAWGLGMTHAF
jgi:hypothetical protein